MQNDPAIESAIDFLRSHTRGDLRFDGNFRPIKYVVSPQDGRLVAPVMVAMLRSVDTALLVPEDVDGALELMVTLEEFDERESTHAALADRWRIYHGTPEDVRWALMAIDAARFQGLFIDGEAFRESDPLQAGEAQLCRAMNKEHIDGLRRLCTERGGMAVKDPVMVGLDSRGIDVRAMFEIVRVRFPHEAKTIDEARRMLLEDA